MNKTAFFALVVASYILSGDCLMGHGEICTTHNDCNATMACMHSPGVSESCPVKVCLCIPGKEFKEAMCESVYKVGDACIDEPTRCPSGSKCVDDVCTCLDRHAPNKHNLHRCDVVDSGKLQFPCDPTISESMCNTRLGFTCNAETSRCGCRPGHVYHPTGRCLPDSQGTDEQCTVDKDCGAGFKYECVSKRCRCLKGYRNNNLYGGCMPQEGYQCSDNYGCAAPLLCKNQKCSCQHNMTLFNQGIVNTCVNSDTVSGMVALNGTCEEDLSKNKMCKPGLTCTECGPIHTCLIMYVEFSAARSLLPHTLPTLVLLSIARLALP